MLFVMLACVVSVISVCLSADAAETLPDNGIRTSSVTESADTAEADPADTDDGQSGKAIAAAIAIGLAAAAGAVGMGIAIAKSSEGISRQPEAEGKIRTNLMIGLVFIETAIIYALIVSILIIFVL